MFNRAKDSGEKLGGKKLVRRVALSTLLPFFVSCSGGGDTKSGGSDDPGVTVLPEKIESTVQMFGNLSNANVVLKTLDGVVLYETTTDENGKYVIDPVLFNQKLASNFLTGESNIVIEAYSGRDEEFDKDMNGVINAVIKAKNIDGSFVSYYSDFVYNILFGEYGSNLEIFKNENGEICPDLIRKKIDQIITGLGTDDIGEDGMLMGLKMNDINGDGKVDRDDLNIYDVIENRNFGLKTLQYRQSLYSGNDVGKAIFLNAERNRLNFVSLVNQKVESGAFSMNLVGSDYYGQVEYSYDGENWIPANELTLNIGETIQYREQYRDNLGYSSIGEFSLTQELYNDLEINGPINELCETGNDNSGGDTDSGSSGEDDNTDTGGEDNGGVDDTQIVISDITTGTITDSQTQEVNDNLVIDSNPSSETQDLTEIVIGVDQAEVDRINGELTTLKADITKKEEELEANKTSLTNLKTGLSNLQSGAIGTYNDSEYSSKVLVDTSLSGGQKKIELEGNLDGKYQYAYTVYEKDSYEGKVFLSSIGSTTITQGTQVTNEMIAELEQKIATEEKDLLQKQKELKQKQDDLEQYKKDNKTEIDEYNAGKKEKEKLIKTLDESQAREILGLDFKYIIERLGIEKAKQRLQEMVDFYKKPNSNDYEVDTSTKEYSDLFVFDYNLFNLYGKKLTAHVNYGYSSDYPAKMYFEYDGNKTSEKLIGNAQHKEDWKKYMSVKIAGVIIKEELEKIEAEILIMEVNALILKVLFLQIGEVEKFSEEYNKLKTEIDEITASIKADKKKLEKYKKQIGDFGDDLEAIDIQEGLIADVTDEQTQINEELEGLNTDKNELVTELELAENGEEREIINTFAVSSTGTITVGGKVFSMTIGAKLEDKITKEELEKILAEKMAKIKATQHIETFEYKGETVRLTNRVIYYINGETKYPALMWGDYSAFGIERESKVYKINESYPGEGDGVKESIGNQLENSVLNIGTYDNYEQLIPNSNDQLCQFKAVVHYNYLNNGSNYPAKVGIHYKIGNHEYFKYLDTLAQSESQKESLAKKLIKETRDTIKLTQHSATGVNAGKTIWWDGEYTIMTGGAYNIYQVPDGYIATYKVANRGTWHVSTVWSDADALKEEVNRIMDDWVKSNSSEPVEGVDDGREEVGEIIIDESLNSLSFDVLLLEHNNLYSQLQRQNCIDLANEALPLTGSNSLLTNGDSQVEYIEECLINAELQKKYDVFFSKLFNLGKEYGLRIMINDPNLTLEHKKGLSKGIIDGGMGILNQPKDLYNLGNSIFNGTKDGLERFAKILGLGLLYGYDSFVDSERSNEILNKGIYDISLEGAQIQEEIDLTIEKFSEVERRITWIRDNLETIKSEQVEYYRGYLEGYGSTLVGEAIALTYLTKKAGATFEIIVGSEAYRNLIKLLNNLERQIRLSKEIFKITNNKLDFDLLSKLNKVEVEKYHLLLQQSLNTFPLDKQKRFFDRMNQMDELMMKEYINKPQKYIDNFEVGGDYNLLIYEKELSETLLKRIRQQKFTPTVESVIIDGITVNKYKNGVKTVKGQHIYIIKDGKIEIVKVKEGRDGFFHSDLAENKNIDYGGTIEFSNQGTIKKITNCSGHYLPSSSDKDIILDVLDVDMSLFDPCD